MAVQEPATAERAPYARIAAISVGFGGLMLVTTLYNAQMQFLLRDYFSSRGVIGALMGVDALIALALIPIVGAWSDRLEGRLGKRLPFILIGMPIAAVTFALLPSAGRTALWTLLLCDAVFMTASALYRGPLIALMPDHCPASKRSGANGLVNLVGGIGSALALGVVGPLFDIDRNLSFGIAAAVLLLACVVVWRSAERHPAHVARAGIGTLSDAAVEQSPVSALIDLIRGAAALFRSSNRGQLLVLAAIFCYFIGFSSLDNLFPLYGVEVLGLTEGEATQVVTYVAVAFIIGAVPAGFLGNRIGKAPSMLLGMVLMPGMFIVASFQQSPTAFPVLLIFGGIAWALINVQAYPLVADLGGLSRIGFFTGMYYLFQNASQAIGPGIMGVAMDVFGDVWLFWGGAASFVVAFVLLRAGANRLAEPEDVAETTDPLAAPTEPK